jgi:uncharacterized membrane protein
VNLEAPHLHLMVNHVPVLGTPFALALGAAGLWRRQDVLIRAALVALVLVAGFAWATARTGHEAEEIVEELPGVSHDRIHRHEEAAEWAARGSIGLGLLALAVLLVGRRLLSRAAAAVVLVLAAGLSGWLAWTANLGGEIRHPEIRSGASSEIEEGDGTTGQGGGGRGRGRGRGRGGDS